MLKKKRVYVLGMLCMSLVSHSIQAAEIEEQVLQNERSQNEARILQSERSQSEEQDLQNEGSRNDEQDLQSESLQNDEQDLQNEGLQNDEQDLQSESLQNDEQVFTEVLMKEVWGISDERYQAFTQGEETLTKSQLAQMLCYILQLSPTYSKERNESPYITRLKIEGIWLEVLEEEEEPAPEAIQALLERVKLYNKEKTHKPFYLPAPIGFLKESTMHLEIEGQSFPLYALGDVNYVSLTHLKQSNFQVTINSDYTTISFNKDEPNSFLNETAMQTTLINQVAVMNPQKIYVGNILTYSLQCGDQTLIPLRSLSEYFNLNVEGTYCTLQEKYNISKHYIELQPGIIHNVSDEIVDATIVSVFWNGKEIIEDQLVIEGLLPGEYYPLNEELYGLDDSVTHMSTMITQIQTKTAKMQAPYKSYGQHTESLLKTYTANQNESVSTYIGKLFPASKIIGTMKYDSNGFKKGEKVEVWAAEDGECYYLLKNGKKITVPWSSVSIPPSPKAAKDEVPKEILEGYVNSQGIKSKTPYFIWTDLYRQKTYVFENKQGNWQLLRSMPTSTGKNKTPTPAGEFEVQAYVPAFGMDKGYRCKNALHLFGDYLYHSVMFDIEGKYVIGGQGQLGERASHGCLRLSPENSEWLYKTMPLGTKVLIR